MAHGRGLETMSGLGRQSERQFATRGLRIFAHLRPMGILFFYYRSNVYKGWKFVIHFLNVPSECLLLGELGTMLDVIFKKVLIDDEI